MFVQGIGNHQWYPMWAMMIFGVPGLSCGVAYHCLRHPANDLKSLLLLIFLRQFTHLSFLKSQYISNCIPNTFLSFIQRLCKVLLSGKLPCELLYVYLFFTSKLHLTLRVTWVNVLDAHSLPSLVWFSSVVMPLRRIYKNCQMKIFWSRSLSKRDKPDRDSTWSTWISLIYHNGKNSQLFTKRCNVMLIYHSDYMDIICLYNATVSVEYFVHTTYFIGSWN